MMTPSDPFMIRVRDWEAHIADYRSASITNRAILPHELDLSYDSHPEAKLDLYFPQKHVRGGKPLPVNTFVQGGYWRSFSKNDYAFLADVITAYGSIAAIIDYTLMPSARLGIQVVQIRRAAQWLEQNSVTFGGDAQAISASGHSAGAHLVTFLICRAAHEGDVDLPHIRAVLLVSGIYDLEPITYSFLQPELQLTKEEVDRWSPVLASPRSDAYVALVVGERETTPFHEQAARFAGLLTLARTRNRLLTIPGEDHMTIARELGRPGTACAEPLESIVGRWI